MPVSSEQPPSPIVPNKHTLYVKTPGLATQTWPLVDPPDPPILPASTHSFSPIEPTVKFFRFS